MESYKEVALLFDDLTQAERIDQLLKIKGFTPVIYSSLREFWPALMGNNFFMCIIDVKKLNEKNLNLKNHPLVKTNSTFLVLFYDEFTFPLFESSYHLPHFASINEQHNLMPQIDAAIANIEKFYLINSQLSELKTETKNYRSNLTAMSEDQARSQQRFYYSNYLKQVIFNFEKNKKMGDFFSVCEDVFSRMEEVEEFSFLQLNPEGKRIVSIKSSKAKYRQLPPFWLGDEAEAFDFNVQSAVISSCIDMMGENIIPIIVRGKNSAVNALIVVKSSKHDFFSEFDWEGLEIYFEGLWAQLENTSNFLSRNLKENLLITPWELCAFLDKGDLSFPGDGPRVIAVRFVQLTRALALLGGADFCWQSFSQGFLKGLAEKIHLPFKVCLIGLEAMTVVCLDEKKFDSLFNQLKDFCEQFPYWKYWNDCRTVMGKDLSPELKEIPPSMKILSQTFSAMGLGYPVADMGELNRGRHIQSRLLNDL